MSIRSFWQGIVNVTLTIVAAYLGRAIGYLRAGTITGLLVLCAGLAGWVGPATASAEEALPDGRVYEMVTPASNQDANVYVPYALGEEHLSQGVETLFPFQVSPDGAAVTYIGDATTGGQGETGKGLGDQYLARRTESGWQQSTIQPTSHQKKTHFQGFSSDLSTGVLVSGNAGETESPPLSDDAPGKGYSVLYARNDFAGEEGPGQAIFQPFFTSPLFFNRTAKQFATGSDVNTQGKSGETPVFAGGSSSFGELFFEANDDVTAANDEWRSRLDARIRGEIVAGEDNDYLYRSVDGRSTIVDVLPDGEVAGNGTFGAPPFPANAERNPPDFGGVVSGDGRWVYWTDETTGTIYVRIGSESTAQVSGSSPARYWTSADEGRYAFYVENEELYRFDAVSEVSEPLTGPGSGVQGVLGASEDGEDVYAVTSSILPESSANKEGVVPVEEPGVVNLYLLVKGVSAPVFIATLSGADGSAVEPMASSSLGHRHSEFGDWQPGLGHRTAGVSSGGLVFMSDRGLPAVGFPGGFRGGADEVYMYQAATNQLFCVSCSPSGEPVSGGAAAFLPVSWSDVHLPEWTADEGNRVFFDSNVPLVSQDTNGRQDVYEWEREGTGGCTPGSGANGGCIYLLSGGTSEADSWFIGASESGDDVFIATRAQLASQDRNDAFDLYDARVGGVQSVSEPLCTGTGCQGAPAPAPTFATPASVTFTGVGNFPPPVETKAVVEPKAKPLTRAQKLAKALKACHKQSKAKRAGCEARARREFGSVRSKAKQKK